MCLIKVVFFYIIYLNNLSKSHILVELLAQTEEINLDASISFISFFFSQVEGGNPHAQVTINKNDVAMQGQSIIDGVTYEWTVMEEDDGAQFSCIGTHVSRPTFF